ncbi:MAG: TonB-dependent receptor [Bacteroidales bacterium]|jgi:outer membrane receptor for ferrienterochelin and colicins|nr:TonB-dependent receptor [Bacteroidales bacterium]
MLGILTGKQDAACFMKQFLFFYFLLFSGIIYSQEARISGHVTGIDSISVSGATIVIEGTTLGTITDNKGFYYFNKINPGTYTLRVSLLGYETQENTITIPKGESYVDFILKESNINLNEVVVTGTRSEKTLKNVPVITQVINARQMLNLGIVNITNALQNTVPGLDVSQFGTRTSITMQGMDAKYVLFLVDGERIAGEVNGDIDYSMLNMENIDRIEVIKGASSSLYGSNAIGGVINIITKKITESFDGKLYSRYSKYNELFSGGSISLKKGTIGSRTSLNYSRTDGYDITPESPHDWTQNPYASFSINQKFEITPGSRLSLVPYLGYYQFERGNVSARPAHDLYQDLNAGIKGQYYLGKHSIDFSYYRDSYNTFNVLELLNNKKDRVSYDIIHTLRTQGNFLISDKNNLIAGLEYNYESLFSIRNEGGLKGEGEEVLYVQEDLRLGERWNIVAGIRASHHSSYGLNAAPKISVLFKQGFLNFRTSVGTGFRSPALKELYMNFDHFGEWYIIGNKQLKPESSGYISGSVEFLKSWNNSSVTVYRNALTNMISDRWLPDSIQLTRQYQNVASASVYGIDLLSKQKVCAGLLLSTGYSYVHSHDNQTGLQLYGTTKHSGNIAADYNFRKKNFSFSAQIYCKLMGEKFYEITTEGTFRDRPYSSWRFTVSQEYKWLRLSTGLDNIFNVTIPQNIDFISPGRSFFIGLNIDFGKIR